MNDTYVTVVGNAVDAPTHRQFENGTSVCNFRVASTARRFDRESGRWADGDSLFLKVACWRQLAENVVHSVGKGDPVIVVGRLYTRSYEVEGQRRSSYEIDAVSVGHDLCRGVSDFRRPVRPAPTYEVAADGDGTGSCPDDERDDVVEPDYAMGVRVVA
ncbi:MAG TPA: single-stranded DNA-binding protein [Mycobacteriales bacterium]|jgi:single-strand DNA-binding protein